GSWMSLPRPPVIVPDDGATDDLWAGVADAFYREQRRLYGSADYYAGDVLHEWAGFGAPDDPPAVNLTRTADAVLSGMRRASPGAVWLVQGWLDQPDADLTASLARGDVIVLDLNAEFGSLDRPTAYHRAANVEFAACT